MSSLIEAANKELFCNLVLSLQSRKIKEKTDKGRIEGTGMGQHFPVGQQLFPVQGILLLKKRFHRHFFRKRGGLIIHQEPLLAVKNDAVYHSAAYRAFIHLIFQGPFASGKRVIGSEDIGAEGLLLTGAHFLQYRAGHFRELLHHLRLRPSGPGTRPFP